MSNLAINALKAYKGNTIIYIGEWYGCTADDKFHETLSRDWIEIEHVDIPVYDCIRDYMTVHKRK